MRNLHRVGKNAGRVWSCLWTKVHDILRQCRRHLVVVNALDRLSASCFVPKILAIKVAVKLRSRPKKVVFGPPICSARGYARFRTCVFKLHLLPTMWPIFVEFRSATSEIRRRKKEEERRRRNTSKIEVGRHSMSGGLNSRLKTQDGVRQRAIVITGHYATLARSVVVVMHFKGAADGRAGPDFRPDLIYSNQITAD